MRGIDRLLGRLPERENYTVQGLTFSDYVTYMTGGNTYFGLNQTLQGKYESIGPGFESVVVGALKSDSVVFAVEQRRFQLFSEARFQFQKLQSGRPGNLFGSPALEVLEHPWPNGTTGDLLARMILDADFAGNCYLTRSVRTNGWIRRLQPDKVTIVMGSTEDVENPQDALDCTVIGYLYTPRPDVREFLPAVEVCHFAPTPDPLANFRGMSWITPVLREIEADKAATGHKLKFFENGATPNIIMKMDPALSPKQVEEFADLFKANNEGMQNAYKTLFAGGGADPMVVGANLQQIDFKATQGAGETRIAAAAGVPTVIAQLSEGLSGSSLNEGNFGAARRLMADATLRPLWRNAAASLETLVPPPAGSRLWYDTRDVAFLREDEKDAADIEETKATTIMTLVNSGFEPESAVAAVQAQNMDLLVHTGLVSVQLQPPGTVTPDPDAATEPGDTSTAPDSAPVPAA